MYEKNDWSRFVCKIRWIAGTVTKIVTVSQHITVLMNVHHYALLHSSASPSPFSPSSHLLLTFSYCKLNVTVCVLYFIRHTYSVVEVTY